MLQVDGIQSIGGTGSLRIGLDLLHSVLGYDTVYVSKPTWRKFKQDCSSEVFSSEWRIRDVM